MRELVNQQIGSNTYTYIPLHYFNDYMLFGFAADITLNFIKKRCLNG